MQNTDERMRSLKDLKNDKHKTCTTTWW